MISLGTVAFFFHARPTLELVGSRRLFPHRISRISARLVRVPVLEAEKTSHGPARIYTACPSDEDLGEKAKKETASRY